METLFITGPTYYNKIKTKQQSDRSWYDNLYIVYYENFYVLVVLLICIILYNYISIPQVIAATQKGGFSYAQGIGREASWLSKKTRLSKATKNIERIKSLGKKETYKKLGSKISSGVSTGYEKSKELGARGLEYGRQGVDQFKESSSVIYKYVAIIFLGIGFTMYILPVVAMFLIGAITFLIVRKDITKLITS
jgi:hypothetical protein